MQKLLYFFGKISTLLWLVNHLFPITRLQDTDSSVFEKLLLLRNGVTANITNELIKNPKVNNTDLCIALLNS